VVGAIAMMYSYLFRESLPTIRKTIRWFEIFGGRIGHLLMAPASCRAALCRTQWSDRL